jgi:hypothetical protein
MLNMCVYKKNHIEFYRDGYSCHMNDTTAVIRKNQDFCVGKAIKILTYAMFYQDERVVITYLCVHAKSYVIAFCVLEFVVRDTCS